MAVSQQYLSLLDEINSKRNFTEYEIDHLLADMHENWRYLQTKYPTYRIGYNTYSESIKHVLFDLSEIGYELLYQLMKYDVSFEYIISAAKELHINKNAGYSPDDTDCWENFRECTKFGINADDGCLVRLCDKYSRFKSVYSNSNNDKVGESAIDTLKDFCAYCLILILLIEEGE